MRLFNALNDRPIYRIPTFCSGCSQTVTLESMEEIGVYWPEAHSDPRKMAELSASTYDLTGLEIAGVPFCVSIEAEALGCFTEIGNKKDSIPQVTGTPYTDFEEVKVPDDLLTAGRVPVILEAINILKEQVGDTLPIVAGMIGPFTLACYLAGIEPMLKGLIRKPDKYMGFIELATQVGAIYGQALKEAGADVITLHEMGASTDIISPTHFDEFVKQYIMEITKRVKTPTVLNICGSTMPILESMMDCGATAIAVDERTPINSARKLADSKEPGYPIIGNIPAYDLIHAGPMERMVEAVDSAIEMGVNMVAPGCDFWLETPTANIGAFVDAVVKHGKP